MSSVKNVKSSKAGKKSVVNSRSKKNPVKETINWEVLFQEDATALTEYAFGMISLRNYRKSLPVNVKSEVSKIEKLYPATYGRKLARRALYRRDFI